MSRTVNLNKSKNMCCEHCAYFVWDKSKRGKDSHTFCLKNEYEVKYYNKCPCFEWSPTYLSINKETTRFNEKGQILCRRCGRPLTDDDSRARQFGHTCYLHRLNSLRQKVARLF